MCERRFLLGRHFWRRSPFCRDVLHACLLQRQTPTFHITLFCRNIGPPSQLQPFPIKLVCTAIHELPYLHLAVSFIQIINGQTETELNRLICFSSYPHKATPITDVTTVVSALICKLRNIRQISLVGAADTWRYSKCRGSRLNRQVKRGYTCFRAEMTHQTVPTVPHSAFHKDMWHAPGP